MTAPLHDPKNPGVWLDGSPRSLDNCFTQGWTGQPLDISDMVLSAKYTGIAVRQLAKKRAQGADFTVMALRHNVPAKRRRRGKNAAPA